MSETESGSVNVKIELEVGRLTPVQLNALLLHLPVDITFVDEHDTVLYYSQTRDRVFTRIPAVIGRKVQDCHPSPSVDVVERILGAFKAGERNSAEFWIQTGGKFILIRYLAVRDDNGQYLGCLEVTQDVTAVRKLEGQQRLLDWK